MGKPKTTTAAAAPAATPAPSPTPAAAPAQPWAKTEDAGNPTPDASAATDVAAPAADTQNPPASGADAGNGGGASDPAPAATAVNDATGDGSQQPKADPEATPGPETPLFDETGKELVTPDNKSNPDDHTPQTSPSASEAAGFEGSKADEARQNVANEAAARNEENRDRDEEERVFVPEEEEAEFEDFYPSEEGLAIGDRVRELDPADRAEFERTMERQALDLLKKLERGKEARGMVLKFVEPGTHFGTIAERRHNGEDV